MDPSWYYAHGDSPTGPLQENEILALLASGTITPQTLLWTEGMESWTPAHQLLQSPDAQQPPHDLLETEIDKSRPSNTPSTAQIGASISSEPLATHSQVPKPTIPPSPKNTTQYWISPDTLSFSGPFTKEAVQQMCRDGILSKSHFIFTGKRPSHLTALFRNRSIAAFPEFATCLPDPTATVRLPSVATPGHQNGVSEQPILTPQVKEQYNVGLRKPRILIAILLVIGAAILGSAGFYVLHREEVIPYRPGPWHIVKLFLSNNAPGEMTLMSGNNLPRYLLFVLSFEKPPEEGGLQQFSVLDVSGSRVTYSELQSISRIGKRENESFGSFYIVVFRANTGWVKRSKLILSGDNHQAPFNVPRKITD